MTVAAHLDHSLYSSWQSQTN